MTVAAPKHPAKYSEPIIDRLRVLVQAERRRVVGRVHVGPLLVLDPFAGVGRIHRLAHSDPRRGIRTVGIEIEKEWADFHNDTICADALEWMRNRPNWCADVVATSPTYGNRFADHHNAQDGSVRRSYTHDLGHDVTEGSSAAMHWGPHYWAFHVEAWRRVYDVLRPGGLFLLNVSDFYRQKQLVHAVEWHRGAAMGAGFIHAGSDARIDTARLRGHGNATTSARATHEVIMRFRRPEFEAA